MLYIPELYNDEFLYSYLSRIVNYNLIFSWRDIKKELFNNENYVFNIFTQTNLNNLSLSLSKSYFNIFNNDNIINHTPFQYMKPFLKHSEIDQIINGFKYTNKGLVSKLRIFERNSYIDEKRKIKVCRECIEEDIKKNGEIHLRLEHHIPGNKICRKHGTYLNSIDTSNLGVRDILIISNINKQELSNEKVPNKFMVIHNKLMDYFDWMVKNYPKCNYENMIKKLNARLVKKGYKYEIINHNRLFLDFIDFYGEEILDFYGLKVENETNNWLFSVFRSRVKTFHPFKYLLIINFLFDSIEDYSNEKEDFKVFSELYPCLNELCPYYMQNKAALINQHNSNHGRGIIGYFKCKECGLTYTSKWEDLYSHNKYKYGYILDYGFLWENKLVELINTGHSLERMSDIMQCDKETIVNNSIRLNIYNKLNSNMKKRSKNKNDKINRTINIDDYKDIITNTVKSKPDISRSELYKNLTKEYNYLYRHDKEWLEKTLPKPKVNIKRVIYDKEYFNKLDIEICKKLNKLIKTTETKEIINKNKLTLNYLYRKTGNSQIVRKSIHNKLPKTKLLLEEICKNI